MPKTLIHSALSVLVAGLSFFLLACGSNDDAESAEKAFLQEMIPHHQSAVEMADIALVRSQRSEILELANNIKRDQNREIEQMQRMLGQTEVMPPMEHAGMAGMADMAATDVEQLRTAEPFDRAFIDAMIPHHESAIQSAQEVKNKAKNQDVKDLADAIISAQEREIVQMREWRRQWYGS